MTQVSVKSPKTIIAAVSPKTVVSAISPKTVVSAKITTKQIKAEIKVVKTISVKVIKQGPPGPPGPPSDDVFTHPNFITESARDLFYVLNPTELINELIVTTGTVTRFIWQFDSGSLVWRPAGGGNDPDHANHTASSLTFGGSKHTGFMPIINAKTDFGAKGDGVTNDSASIQGAINSANSSGGGIVYLEPGVYSIHAVDKLDELTMDHFFGLLLKSNVILRGAGIGITVLKQADSQDIEVITNDRRIRQYINTAGTFTFSGSTITDSASLFTGGLAWQIGEVVRVRGTDNNDGEYVVTDATASVLTFSATTFVTDSPATTVALLTYIAGPTTNCALQNFSVDGNGVNQTFDDKSLNFYQIRLAHIEQLEINNVEVFGTNGMGLRLADANHFSIPYMRVDIPIIENILSENAGRDGVHLDACAFGAIGTLDVSCGGDDNVALSSFYDDLHDITIDSIITSATSLTEFAGRGLLINHANRSVGVTEVYNVHVKSLVGKGLLASLLEIVPTNGVIRDCTVNGHFSDNQEIESVRPVPGPGNIGGTRHGLKIWEAIGAIRFENRPTVRDCTFNINYDFTDSIFLSNADSAIKVDTRHYDVGHVENGVFDVDNCTINAKIYNVTDGSPAVILKGDKWTGSIEVNYDPNNDKVSPQDAVEIYGSDCDLRVNIDGSLNGLVLQPGASGNRFDIGTIKNINVNSIVIPATANNNTLIHNLLEQDIFDTGTDNAFIGNGGIDIKGGSLECKDLTITNDVIGAQIRAVIKIEFTVSAATVQINDNGALDDTITDSANGFVFSAGDIIVIKGTSFNNGEYLLTSSTSGILSVSPGSFADETPLAGAMFLARRNGFLASGSNGGIVSGNPTTPSQSTTWSLNSLGSGDRGCNLDMVANDVDVLWSARILRQGGTSGDLVFRNKGTGDIRIQPDDTVSMTLLGDGTGDVDVVGILTAFGFVGDLAGNADSADVASVASEVNWGFGGPDATIVGDDLVWTYNGVDTSFNMVHTSASPALRGQIRFLKGVSITGAFLLQGVSVTASAAEINRSDLTDYTIYASGDSADIDDGTLLAATPVPFNTVTHNPLGVAAPASPLWKIPIPEPGKYRINANITMEPTSKVSLRVYPVATIWGDPEGASNAPLGGAEGQIYLRQNGVGGSCSMSGVLTTTNTSGTVSVIISGGALLATDLFHSVGGRCSLNIVKIG